MLGTLRQENILPASAFNARPNFREYPPITSSSQSRPDRQLLLNHNENFVTQTRNDRSSLLQAIRTSAPKRRTAPIPRGRSIHYRSPFASCDDASKQPRRTPPAQAQPQPQPRQASTRHRQPSSRTASQPDSSASLRHHPAWAQEQAAQYRNS